MESGEGCLVPCGGVGIGMASADSHGWWCWPAATVAAAFANYIVAKALVLVAGRKEQSLRSCMWEQC